MRQGKRKKTTAHATPTERTKHTKDALCTHLDIGAAIRSRFRSPKVDTAALMLTRFRKPSVNVDLGFSMMQHHRICVKGRIMPWYVGRLLVLETCPTIITDSIRNYKQFSF